MNIELIVTKVMRYLMVVVVGIVIGLGLGLLAAKYQPEPEVECLSGYVTVEGPYGQRLVMGDMEICGIDLEIGNIIGPSKLYNSGDPL